MKKRIDRFLHFFLKQGNKTKIKESFNKDHCHPLPFLSPIIISLLLVSARYLLFTSCLTQK